jgi:hypothetical protein
MVAVHRRRYSGGIHSGRHELEKGHLYDVSARYLARGPKTNLCSGVLAGDSLMGRSVSTPDERESENNARLGAV